MNKKLQTSMSIYESVVPSANLTKFRRRSVDERELKVVVPRRTAYIGKRRFQRSQRFNWNSNNIDLSQVENKELVRQFAQMKAIKPLAQKEKRRHRATSLDIEVAGVKSVASFRHPKKENRCGPQKMKIEITAKDFKNDHKLQHRVLFREEFLLSLNNTHCF